MDTKPYWKMVLRNAGAKTFTHVTQRLLVGLVVSVIVAVSQYLLKIRSLNDTAKIFISLVAGPFIVGLFFFVKNIVAEPASLYVGKGNGPVERERLERVGVAVDKRGPNARVILMHLRVHGVIKTGSEPITVLPDGMEEPEAQELLMGLTADGIVEESRIEFPFSPGKRGEFERHLGIGRTQSDWRVLPAMESAVDEFLG